MHKLGNQCDLIVVTNGVHGLVNWDKEQLEYKPQLIDWLKKTLNGNEASS
jgi:hypothetical protein